MPFYVLRPTSNFTVDWDGAGYSAVNEQGQDPLGDGDTTYISAAAPFPTKTERLGISGDPGLGNLNDQTITNVRVSIAAKRVGGSSASLSFGLSNGSTDQSTGVSLTTTYAEYTKDFATNPFTFLAWQPSEISGLLFYLKTLFASGGPEYRVTLARMLVTVAEKGVGIHKSFAERPATPNFETKNRFSSWLAWCYHPVIWRPDARRHF